MVSFEMHAGLKKAIMKLKRGERTDLLNIDRPFYKDILEVSWLGTRYTIVRSGILVRNAKIFKKGEYLGSVEEKIGVMTHFDVYRHDSKMVSLHEHETLLKQEFEIKKNGDKVGRMRSVGVYIPILSNLGKGIEGEYFDLSEEEEEMAVLAMVAIGI